jgi:hypothetical protein
MKGEQEVVAGSVPDSIIQAEAAPKKKGGRPKKLAPLGTPERTKYQTKAVQDHRARAAEAEDQAAQQISSDKAPKDDEAKEILRSEGVRNPHVQDVLIENAKIAAVHYQIPYNRYLLKNGLRKTLADLKSEAFDVPVIGEDEIIDGEILFKRDLYYLWDFGYFRQPAMFPEWLDIRFKSKSSAFYLGKEILGMDFHELHQHWTEFFPQFDPRGLKPQFSMEDAKAWLARQSAKKTFVLQCSRNSYKSSFAAILALAIILCQPSIRCRLVTATDDLSSDFVSAIREYFVIQIPDSPSLFAQLFGEYCIPPDKGQVAMYECPLAHLNLVAATCEASSMGSKQAGRRCDLLLCDDLQEEDSIATESLRGKGISKFDLLQKLVEIGGYTISLSTPWHKKDISGILIERSENDPDTLTVVRIDPAWEVLPHARKKPILELKETDVKLIFPERLTYKFLMSEAKKNLKQFMSQNLCIFPEDANAEFKCNFDEQTMRSLVVFQNHFLGWNLQRTVISVDCNHTVGARADYGVVCASRLYRDPKSDRLALVVWEVDANRYTPRELAGHIVEMAKKHNPSPGSIVIEKPPLHSLLEDAIREEGVKRGYPHITQQIYWAPTVTRTMKSKAQRIKLVETLTSSVPPQLYFINGDWVELSILQFIRFDGLRKSGSAPESHDDIPDAISRGVERVQAELMRIPPPQKTQADMDEEQRRYNDFVRQQVYQAIHGTGPNIIPHSIQPAVPSPPRTPLDPTINKLGLGGFFRR